MSGKKNKSKANAQKPASIELTAAEQQSLISSSASGDARGVEFILKRHIASGARHLRLHSNGLTPLVLAALAGHAECVKLLLPVSNALEGLGVGQSALDYAIGHGHDDVALILAAAHQGAILKNGLTPLMVAVGQGLTDKARLLLPFSDARATDDRGATALMSVSQNSGEEAAIEMLNLLLPHSDIDAQDDRGQTALMRAIDTGKNAIAKALLAAGANAKLTDRKGRTALSLTTQFARYSDEERFSEDTEPFLDQLARASDVHATDAVGRTALILAVKNMAIPAAVRFFARRVDPHARDAAGRSAFDWAVRKNHRGAIEALAATASESDIERLLIQQGQAIGPSIAARIEGFLLRASVQSLAARPSGSAARTPLPVNPDSACSTPHKNSSGKRL